MTATAFPAPYHLEPTPLPTAREHAMTAVEVLAERARQRRAAVDEALDIVRQLLLTRYPSETVPPLAFTMLRDVFGVIDEVAAAYDCAAASPLASSSRESYGTGNARLEHPQFDVHGPREARAESDMVPRATVMPALDHLHVLAAFPETTPPTAPPIAPRRSVAPTAPTAPKLAPRTNAAFAYGHDRQAMSMSIRSLRDVLHEVAAVSDSDPTTEPPSDDAKQAQVRQTSRDAADSPRVPTMRGRITLGAPPDWSTDARDRVGQHTRVAFAKRWLLPDSRPAGALPVP